MSTTRRCAGHALALALLLLLVPGVGSAQGNRVDLRVLLVTDGAPPVEALRAHLARLGIPVDVLDLGDLGRRRIDDALLADGPHAHYQGVVLPDQAPTGLPPAELAALHSYEQRFGIRQLDASVTATPAVGLTEPTDTVGYSGPFDGGTAQLTPEALAGDFGYARGPVPFSDDEPGADESWVELAPPRPGFLTAADRDGSGRDAQRRAGRRPGRRGPRGARPHLHLRHRHPAAAGPRAGAGRAGSPAASTWGSTAAISPCTSMTCYCPTCAGCRACTARPEADCPPTVAAPPEIRMNPADVAYAVEWQRRTGIRLDLAFNGAGSVAADAGAGTDPLIAALVTARAEFGWINHTWSHRYLGCVRDYSTTPWSCATAADPGVDPLRQRRGSIESEIDRNIGFARRNGLPIDPTELVTGEHGGLRAPPQMPDDNPRLAGALPSAGIRTLAADASSGPTAEVGGAVTVPRHPIDLDFDTATVTETIDQYNWVHTSRADGGNGECEADGGCLPPAAPGTGFADHIVPVEARKVLDHVLTNDPRPHYVHQPQLTEDRTLYPLLDRVIGDYRAGSRTAGRWSPRRMTQVRAGARPAAALGRGGREPGGCRPGSRTAGVVVA